MKTMRYFNGRCPFNCSTGHGHICAYSKAEAVRLGRKAFGNHFSISELNTYWAECWGTAAQETLGEQTEPGVFWSNGNTHFFKAVW